MSNGELLEPQTIRCPCIDMSTTIVRIYTSQGFVVGADGRKYNPDLKEKVDDSVQKIFPIQQPGRQLVYALSGTVDLTPKNSTEVIFDIAAEIDRMVNILAGVRLKSLWHFAGALSEQLTEMPDHAKQAVNGDENPTIIYLDGYYDGRPKRALVKIFYDGQVPEVTTEELPHGYQIGCGSQSIIETLSNEADNRLAKYRTPSWQVDYKDRTLSDAIEIAKCWLSSHCSEEAVTIDPACITMGGRKLISTITRTDGVRWLPNFGLV